MVHKVKLSLHDLKRPMLVHAAFGTWGVGFTTHDHLSAEANPHAALAHSPNESSSASSGCLEKIFAIAHHVRACSSGQGACLAARATG